MNWQSLTIAGTFAVIAAPVVAQTTYCGGTEIVAPAPDVEHWMRKRETFIAPSLRHDVETTYCREALQLLATRSAPLNSLRRVTVAKINDVRGEVIAEYLSNYADPTRAMRTLRAVFRSHLGVQGFSRPVARSFGLVRMTYRNAIDRLELRDRIFEPWPRFMLSPGDAAFVGSRGGRAVCRGRFTVLLSAPVAAVC